MRKIALYGGSFNPIHKIHVLIAETAIEKLSLDELIFLPCYKSVDKLNEDYASGEDRINMIKLVLPFKCSISDYEVNLRRPIESIETIKYFNNLYKGDRLFFIMGEDNLVTIDTWEDYLELDKFADLVVFHRDTKSKRVDSKGLRVIFMGNECWDASSSKVRKNKNTDYLDSRVLEYIKSHSLYGFK